MTDDLESLIYQGMCEARVSDKGTCDTIASAIRARYELKEKAEPELLPLVTPRMLMVARDRTLGRHSRLLDVLPGQVECCRDIVRQSIEAMLERLPRSDKTGENVYLPGRVGKDVVNLDAIRRALLGAP